MVLPRHYSYPPRWAWRLAWSALIISAPECIASPPSGPSTVQESHRAQDRADPVPTEQDKELRRRVEEMQRSLDRLAVDQSKRWMNDRRAAEIRRLITDVLNDVDQRTSLLQTDATAGYDDGFFLTSADGGFKLQVSGYIQQRYVLSHQKDGSDDNTRSGFEVRRAKISVDGELPGPRVSFSTLLASNRRTGDFELQNAYIKTQPMEDLQIRVGRFRSPLLREEAVSSKRQLLAERSLIARTFRQERAPGLATTYETDTMRLNAAFMDSSTELLGDQNWLATARLELLLEGSWKRLKDFTSFPDDEPAAEVGAGVLYMEEDRNDLSDENASLLRWTADVSIEFGGANLFAAIVGNHIDVEGEPFRDQLGVVAQGGLFVTDELEVFGQYLWGEADGEAEELSVAAIGVNYYWHEHNLKWTTDLAYGFNEVGDLWASSGAGWRADREGEEGQIVLRLQLQLLF